MRKFCITFDVDLTDYLSCSANDEMDDSFALIKDILIEFPEVKTTWFIRIDLQIEALYGKSTFIFERHIDKLNWLVGNKHELAWHYHAYKHKNGGWVQNTNEDEILVELEKYGKIAKSLGLNISRMGWGFHTNATLQKIHQLGFSFDSSAIPRPHYKWENIVRDWTNTPNHSYYPCESDYRTDKGQHIGILEIPINTTLLKLESDTEDVRRYINVSYFNHQFKKAIESLDNLDIIVSVTHPYELKRNNLKHNLLSFSIDEFRLNLLYLKEKQFELVTMSSIYNERFKQK